jgi:hypothetical protein
MALIILPAYKRKVSAPLGLTSKGIVGNPYNRPLGSLISKDMTTAQTANSPTGLQTGITLTPAGPATFWSDWGDDVFDGSSYIYLYTSTTFVYIEIPLSQRNLSDGVTSSYSIIAFGKTFTITHGYPTQGMWRMKVECADSTFLFGFGFICDNMGSDTRSVNSTGTFNKTISTSTTAKTLTFRIHEHWDSNNPLLERFCAAIIPYELWGMTPLTANNFTVSTAPGKLSVFSPIRRHGVTAYFSKGAAMPDWIADDLLFTE